MQLPFYHNFESFQKNYNDNQTNWMKIFPDATDDEFAVEYLRQHSLLFGTMDYYPFRIKVQTVDNQKNVHDDFVSYYEYAKIIEIRLKQLADFVDAENFEQIMIKSDPLMLCDIKPNQSIGDSWFYDGYIICCRALNVYSKLFTYILSEDQNDWFIKFDLEDFRKFEYSSKRVVEFLEERSLLNPKKSPVAEVAVMATVPYNEKERGENIPYKIAMMDERGEIERLRMRYPSETDVINNIHYLVGGNRDNVKKYYQSIYGGYSGSKQITEKHRTHARSVYYK